MTALLKKASTRNSAQCTGLRAVITPSAASHEDRAEDVEEDVDDHAAGRLGQR